MAAANLVLGMEYGDFYTMIRNEIAALHARTGGFQYRVIQAEKIILQALDIDATPHVALSGGKDSTVVFEMVKRYKPDITAVWSDDEYFLPETLEYIERLQVRGDDVRQIRTNAKHADWFQISGDWNGIQDYARQHGFGLTFLGLRQEENTARKMHLRRNGALFLTKSDGLWHCNPIHNWTWRDVWAYIVSNELDYNKAYDKLEAMGIPAERQRIGPLAVERVLGYGQLAILRQGWPDLFNHFAAEFPEARNYV